MGRFMYFRLFMDCLSLGKAWHWFFLFNGALIKFNLKFCLMAFENFFCVIYFIVFFLINNKLLKKGKKHKNICLKFYYKFFIWNKIKYFAITKSLKFYNEICMENIYFKENIKNYSQSINSNILFDTTIINWNKAKKAWIKIISIKFKMQNFSLVIEIAVLMH